jgi:ABC-type Fe3+-citrate transport system substrate-binding protein
MTTVIKTFTGSGSINFEEDQQDAMKKTENIQSLADQVEKLEELQSRLQTQEQIMKDTKKQIERLSGEVIPTMMSEMGLAELKLQDGSHLKVSTSYRATITEANKEAAFNWLRNNGLGDIIKNEISVSFGRNEDNKAAHYAELAKGQGFQPTQKMKVEPMTLKALVRERIEAGLEMPTEIFGVFSENKTTIKRNK